MIKDSQLEVESMFNEMVDWAVDEGADLIMGETFYYAEEAYKALRNYPKIRIACSY
jgi:betaine-homocysteine S-methyltransferase